MKIKIWRFIIHNLDQLEIAYKPLICLHYKTKNTCRRVFVIKSKKPRSLSKGERDQLYQFYLLGSVDAGDLISKMNTDMLMRMKYVERYPWGHYGITNGGDKKADIEFGLENITPVVMARRMGEL